MKSCFGFGMISMMLAISISCGNPQPGDNPVQREEIHSSLLSHDSIPPSALIYRSAILNTLVDRYGHQTYLEIGQGRREDTLDRIDCIVKIGVDPNRRLQAAYQMTSDEFFAINRNTFDLIFIDGLHHADQVERDILNALEVLNENGTIVVHDCNPITEEMQRVPLSGQHAWTGDVWKTWVKFRATRPDLSMAVVDTDFGCGIIRRGNQETIPLPPDLTYDVLDKNRSYLLNLISVQDFVESLKNDSE